MKKFDIYLWEVNEDKFLGVVTANNVEDAEIKASEQFGIASDRLYALRKEN